MTLLTSLCTAWAAILAATAFQPVPADQTDGDDSAPRRVIAQLNEIVTPSGIDETHEVMLGGVPQTVVIRGADRSNPILLFVHGGPGVPEMPHAWTYQRAWEDFFTVVQWDQRGAGRSYGLSDPATLPETMTLDRYTEDAVELIEWLRTTYDKEKVILLGHSWGSVVGLDVTTKRPDLLHAYVGVGQVIDARANEIASYARTLEWAEAASNEVALSELKAIAPYPGEALAIEKVITERKWTIFFGGLAAYRENADFFYDSAVLSPLYQARDIENFAAGNALTAQAVLPQLIDVSKSDVDEISVPVVMLLGQHDGMTPPAPTIDWLSDLNAPQKHLVMFEHSAHLLMAEEPGKFLMTLVDIVHPLAGAKTKN